MMSSRDGNGEDNSSGSCSYSYSLYPSFGESQEKERQQYLVPHQ
jgi:hypothetical protein